MSSVGTAIRGVLAVEPNAQALEFDGRWTSWGELDAQVRAIENSIKAAGLGAGARVGILLRNRPLHVAAALEAIVSNRCLVTLNPILPDDKLREDLATLQLPLVVGERSDVERPGVLDTLRSVGSAVIALDDRPALLPGFEKPNGAQVRCEQPDVIIEMLSSGTTGKPKRIPLHTKAFERGFAAGNAYEKGRDGIEAPRLRSGVVFLMLPLTHIGGLWGVVQWATSGRKACLMEKFRLNEWREAVIRHRPKLMAGPPAMLRMILDAHLPQADLASIIAIRTGTAPLDPAIVDEFYTRYGIPVLQNYGATEFAGSVAGWSTEDFRQYRESKRGSVGRVQRGVEARIVDAETLEPLASGLEGLLELRGPQLGREHWLRTTDRAVLDGDGFLYIKGRADNAILRGGFKVHPDDVVRVLESHPSIREACVVGIKDARLGEVPVAALIARPDVSLPSAEELTRYLRERLTAYQVPVQLKFVDELPRTPSMKPSQPAVRSLFA